MSIHELNEAINAWVLHASGQWWVLPIIAALCLSDGIFPVLPSESLVVALSSVWVTRGWFWLTLLAVVSAAGAFAGDQLAYEIGKTMGSRPFAWMRRRRVAKILDMARHQLEHRGAVLIFTARYIPVGRVAVNFTAGATDFPRRAFVLFDSLGCVLWGVYSVAIGALAGHWMENNKLLAIVVSVAIALVLGWALDKLVRWFLMRYRPHSRVLPPAERGTEDDDAA